VRLLDHSDLLDAKIMEEAAELTSPDADVAPEAADLVYFALVKSVAAGVSIEDIERILDHRELRVTRRPMTSEEVE
jgi:phosphoribosyl-ATP pyrophosphohydrolase/phosphoribosyl-AMP cyclohydrolase/histidinol dehydrogenase